MINLRPIYGLGNRMGAIASAVALSRDRGDSLTVYWNQDAGMPTQFEQLFKIPVHFTVADFEDRASKIFSPENPDFYKDQGEPSAKRSAFISKALGDSTRADISIEAWYSFYKCDFTWVRPTDRIQSQIDAVRDQFGPKCIGIHIRRTDNVRAIASSPLSMFIDAMKDIIAREPACRFFLATDDAISKDALQKKFGAKIITRENVSSRWSPGGTEDALIDMMLLASTSKIIGSFGSTYSAVAAAVGGIQVNVICDKSWRVGPRALMARCAIEWQHVKGVLHRRGVFGSIKQFCSRCGV